MKVCKHGVLKSVYCEDCSREPKVTSFPPPKVDPECVWVRVILKDQAGFVDIAQAPGFNLPQWVTVVKGGGGVLAEKIHIPWDNIAFFVIIDDPNIPGNVMTNVRIPPPDQRH